MNTVKFRQLWLAIRQPLPRLALEDAELHGCLCGEELRPIKPRPIRGQREGLYFCPHCWRLVVITTFHRQWRGTASLPARCGLFKVRPQIEKHPFRYRLYQEQNLEVNLGIMHTRLEFVANIPSSPTCLPEDHELVCVS